MCSAGCVAEHVPAGRPAAARRSVVVSWPDSALAALRARAGQSPPAASAMAISASHTSSARSLSPAGMSGSASPIASAWPDPRGELVAYGATLGLSRRIRYLATGSAGALRRRR